MSEIEAAGGNAASPENQNIVDVPSFKPEAETPKVEAEVPAEKPQGEAAQDEGNDQSTEGADAEKAEEPKKRNGYKEKLERERQRVAELEAKLAETTPKQEPKAEPADKRPEQREDETYAEYYERLADWKLDQREKEREAKAREAAEKSALAEKQAAYAAKANEFKSVQEDFDDVINGYNGPLTAHMEQALLDSDVGPQVAYHLAQNPEIAQDMAKMNPIQLGKAFAKLEMEVASPTVDTKPKVTEPKVTKAPPPIAPVGKSAVTSSYDPHRSKGQDDHEEYMRWRKQQK